jgi:RNA polymerase sigma-70 factor (ECF subfamily)
MEALNRSSDAREADDGVSTFINARPRMFAAAFRTLGNASEAEDVVQDAWLRWQNIDRDLVRNAQAFLTTTSVRLAINRALGARARYETPLGVWRSELVASDSNPSLLTEQREALEAALQLLLERLSPAERAAYLLREAFGYDYRRIARIVDASEVNSRQLVTRARKHLMEERHASVPHNKLRRFCEAFLEATQHGELASLEAVLRGDLLSAQ